MLKIIKEQRITKTNVISSDPDIFRDGIENRLIEMLKIIKEQRITKIQCHFELIEKSLLNG